MISRTLFMISRTLAQMKPPVKLSVWIRLPLDDERRASLGIQVASRWGLVIVALAQLNIDPRTTGDQRIVLNLIVLCVAAANTILMRRMRYPQPIAALLPVAISVIDTIAITAAIGVVDHFDNVNFVFYFPAFVAFGLVFPGLSSVWYSLLSVVGYLLVVVPFPPFDRGAIGDWKELMVRVASMGIATLTANIAVRVERGRRQRAVAQALASHVERERVSQEVHDGIAQEIYVLAISLEANVAILEKQLADHELVERMKALVGLAKRALIDTRGLLFNLEPALTGDLDLATLIREQAAEFSAITRIPVSVEADRETPAIAPDALVQIYRIVQEGLANIYRHSSATEGHVRIALDGDYVIVSVSDTGRGFNPGETRDGGHGLTNIRERAERIGGWCRVVSAPGRGTELTVAIPKGGE
jgi:signal transduction histidine kinase